MLIPQRRHCRHSQHPRHWPASSTVRLCCVFARRTASVCFVHSELCCLRVFLRLFGLFPPEALRFYFYCGFSCSGWSLKQASRSIIRRRNSKSLDVTRLAKQRYKRDGTSLLLVKVYFAYGCLRRRSRECGHGSGVPFFQAWHSRPVKRYGCCRKCMAKVCMGVE